MVIICSIGGLGNRLFVFAHFIANACEFNYQLMNPSFVSYAKYFDATSSDVLCRYPSQHSRCVPTCLQKFLHTSSQIFYKVAPRIPLPRLGVSLEDITHYDKIGKNYDLAGREFLQARARAAILIARGWLFRDFSSLGKHAQTVREFFTPKEPHASNISRLLEKAKNNSDILIGIHIRQGDYRIFANGQYYYEVPAYLRLMQQAVELFLNKKVAFLICSNSIPDKSLFRNFNCVMGTNQPVEDMYSFAQCDFLIGPPSTFTGWASFYGQVPVVTISKSDANFTLADVHVYQG